MTSRKFGALLGASLILAAFGSVATASEQAAKGKAEGKMVEFKGGSRMIKGYLAKPEGNGPFPAVVVIHEWWGLTDWVKGTPTDSPAKDMSRSPSISTAARPPTIPPSLTS